MIKTQRHDHTDNVLTLSQASEVLVHILFPGRLGEGFVVDWKGTKNGGATWGLDHVTGCDDALPACTNSYKQDFWGGRQGDPLNPIQQISSSSLDWQHWGGRKRRVVNILQRKAQGLSLLGRNCWQVLVTPSPRITKRGARDAAFAVGSRCWRTARAAAGALGQENALMTLFVQAALNARTFILSGF